MTDCESMTPLGALASGICHLITECKAAETCGEAPEEALPGCDVFCDALAKLCPSDFALAAESCEALCTGVGMVLPVTEPQTGPECLEQFPECPEDPYDALFTCMSGKCGAMCGLFGVCEEDSPYFDLFESPDTCKEYCDTLSISQAQMTSYCLGWAGCGQASYCVDPPEEAAEGCDIYCDTVLGLCPDNGSLTDETCPEGCTGIAMAVPGANPGEADFCLDEFEQCTENPGEVIYWCMAKTEETCSDVCEDLADCDLTIDWVCDVFCTVLKVTEPNGHAAFTSCVSNAGTCDEMKPCIGQ